MVDDVAAGGGARHDGGIRNGGGVVTEDGAAEHGASHQRDADTHVDGHGQGDGGHNCHGTHRSAGGKGQQHGDDKGQQGQQGRGEKLHKDRGEIITGIQRLDLGAHGQSKEQHAGNGQHSGHALHQLAGQLLQGKQPFHQAHNRDHQDRDHAAPKESLHTVALGGVAAAGNHQDSQNGNNHHQHGNEHVFGSGLYTAGGSGGCGIFIGGAGRVVQLAGGVSPQLCLLHGSEVHRTGGGNQGKNDGDDAVEIEGDGVKQGLNGVCFLNAAGGQIAGHGGQPAAEGEEDAPGSRSGMYQERRLLMGQAHTVVERPGHGAGDHAAEGAGGKHHDAQEPGKESGSPLGFDNAPLLYHDVHEAGNTAGALNHIDEGADEQHGHKDDGVAAAGEGVHQAVKGAVKPGEKVEARKNKGRKEETNEQRNKDVFQHKGQHDGNQGWDDG